jgi:hypothetical protein
MSEGLIALKLQGSVNNPRRTQDLEDIRALIRANRDTLNLAQAGRSDVESAHGVKSPRPPLGDVARAF